MLIQLMGLDLCPGTLAERCSSHGLADKTQQLTIVNSYHLDRAAFIDKSWIIIIEKLGSCGGCDVRRLSHTYVAMGLL
jgi:hypothetical protein